MSRFDAFGHAQTTASGADPSSDGAAPDLFRVWTPSELLDAPRSLEWRARGFMVHPTHGMLAGNEKTLKTYVDIVVDLAVATGTPIFGHFEVDKAVPVLKYVGEGGRIPYTRRLERVARAMDVDLRDADLFYSFDVAPVGSAVFAESLRRDLDRYHPGLVGLDPYYAFHGTGADARSLYEEGGQLARLSGPCADAGACLKVVNHNNQTGSGSGLRRITMAGAAEWCDSWWLLSHRRDPDVDGGNFWLLLEIGSRQWGGSSWELDLSVGRLNIDTDEFDGEFGWDLRRVSGAATLEDRIVELVAANPWALTREDIARSVGGRLKDSRAEVDRLLDDRLTTQEGTRVGRDGKARPTTLLGLASQPTEGGT